MLIAWAASQGYQFVTHLQWLQALWVSTCPLEVHPHSSQEVRMPIQPPSADGVPKRLSNLSRFESGHLDPCWYY